MNRYFQFAGRMARVGSVAHQQLGQGFPQYVKAEEFDRLVEERNVLQAQLEWVEGQYALMREIAVLMAVALVAALAGWYWT